MSELCKSCQRHPDNCPNLEECVYDAFEGDDFPTVSDGWEKYQNRNEFKNTPESVEYFKQLAERDVLTVQAIMSKSRILMAGKVAEREKCQLDFDRAKRVVYEIAKDMMALHGKTLVIEDENKEVWANLTKYFIGDPTGKYPLNKGIYLWGNVGLGKTFIARVFANFCQSINYEPTAFKIRSAAHICQEVAGTKDVADLAKYKADTWLIDDIGVDEGTVKIFGTDYDPISEILYARYELFQKTGKVTHVTSNLNPTQRGTGALYNRYGTRLEDRINEMFTFVQLRGKNKRA